MKCYMVFNVHNHEDGYTYFLFEKAFLKLNSAIKYMENWPYHIGTKKSFQDAHFEENTYIAYLIEENEIEN